MQQQNTSHRVGHRPEWKVVKELRRGGFGVNISMVSGPRPAYSMQAGGVRADGTFTPHLPLEPGGLVKIVLKRPLSDLVALITEAEQWVLEEAALRFDERVEKEARDANFNKAQTRVTGKTAKKKARTGQAA